jgi:hypothetical protein
MTNTTVSGDLKKQLKRTATLSAASEQTAEHAAPQDPILLLIDPRLLTGDVDIDDLEKNEDEPSAAVDEAYFDEVVSPTPQTGLAELRIDGVDFVRRFSKIRHSHQPDPGTVWSPQAESCFDCICLLWK